MTKARRRSAQATTAPVPTVKDVARLAGVSTATVSRVLAGSAAVRDNLGERVREAARQLGYRPNQIARSLRVRTTRSAGLLVPDIENPFFASVVCGADQFLQSVQHALVLASFGEDASREGALLATMRSEGVAGIIFAASSQPAPEYTELLQSRMPMVAVARMPETLDVDTVTVANREGSRSAVAHLLRLGHKRVAIITGPASISVARERVAGFEEAFSEAGLAMPDGLIQYADFRHLGGYNAMQALLNLRRRPTAVLVGNNLMTLGALQAIHEHRLKIPSDIALVGFDDSAWAMSLHPPLTAVTQPSREVGAAAARLLLDRIQNPALDRRHVVLETQLVVRSSCGAV